MENGNIKKLKVGTVFTLVGGLDGKSPDIQLQAINKNDCIGCFFFSEISPNKCLRTTHQRHYTGVCSPLAHDSRDSFIYVLHK